MQIQLELNGLHVTADTWAGASLLHMLREGLHLPGSKDACEQGECGSCSVWLDDEVVCACLVLAAQVDGRRVVTIEGLARSDALHPVQNAFVRAGAVQCGFCIPGLIVAATDLLRRDALPSEVTIREALSGNLCRCTGYSKVVEAVQMAAEEMQGCVGWRAG